MATPWDRAAAGYLEEWVPRFVPYHLDLVKELALAEGHSVLVTSCGPGSEALAAARAVGPTGTVRATDTSDAMVAICLEQATKAGFSMLKCGVADAADVTGGPYDAIANAFGMWQLSDRAGTLKSWAGALSQSGKVGIVTWGPPDVDDPFERMSRALVELEPSYAPKRTGIEPDRTDMNKMFEDAGLAMVRHTVVRHTLIFRSAEAFVKALREACTWRRVWEELGDARIERVAAAFYAGVGGPDAPLSFAPAATLAIAALPGAEVELAHRPSVRAPIL